MMFRRLLLPFVALVGIALSIFMIYWVAQKPEAVPITFMPPSSPYNHYVAGDGYIEALHENVDIGVTYPDLITEVFVETGQYVKQCDPLFKTDTRQQEAELLTRISELNLAKTQLEDKTKELSFYERLDEPTAVSENQYRQVYYEQQQAKDRYVIALANVNKTKTDIERAIIRAPKDGIILQRNVQPGEFANINPFDQKSLIIFGDTSKLQVRVNVSEEDAWRVIPNAPATAFVRGNSSIMIPLTFSYIEPYITPKQNLSGSDQERVDTRVLEIIYTFTRNNLPVYVGQLLDVYVEAKPSII
jgi:HlyD family secretion protein